MDFASRAGEKLQYALKVFDVSVIGKICADFGCSTGGFTDCMLQSGAKKVYSVDTGYGQLAWKLRNDTRVVVLERTNAMHVELPEKCDFISIDTSWTKQKNILPNVRENLKKSGDIITLIKPQYEADKKLLKKGVLSSESSVSVFEYVLEEIKELNFNILNTCESPILGGKGKNVEYLAHLRASK